MSTARTRTTSVTDPVGACGSPLRVIRGGSWLFDGNSARCGAAVHPPAAGQRLQPRRPVRA